MFTKIALNSLTLLRSLKINACLFICLVMYLSTYNFGFAQTSATSQVARSPELQKILNQHLAALGQYKNIKTRRVQTEITGMAPFPLNTLVEAKRPHFLYKEVDLQGNKIIQAYDGKRGWKIDPFSASGQQAQAVTDKEMLTLIDESLFDGLLIHAIENQLAIRYLGQEKVNDTTAHVIEVTHPKLGIRKFFLHAGNFLEIKRTQQNPDLGEVELFFSDYRPIAKSIAPFNIEIRSKIMSKPIQLKIKKIEPNIPIENKKLQAP